MFFDSCAHPTIDGSWIGKSTGVNFADFKEEVMESRLLGSVAIGLPGIGLYEPLKYYQQSVSHKFFPVAALTSTEDYYIAAEIAELKKIGYSAVKIHPRLMNVNHDWSFMKPAISRIAEANMTAFVCTYYGDSTSEPIYDPYFALTNAFNSEPNCKVVLLHGGHVRLLEYSLFARHLDNVLLDLSYVMMKYKSTSIAMDIRFLMNDLDQKLCIGSDSPEWSTKDIVSELISYRDGISSEKFKNICCDNIMGLLGIGFEPHMSSS